MRYAILADIHGNLNAFQAVLRDIDNSGGVESLLCLGDIVGYGPDPHECIELLQQYDHVCVAGNHDWAAVGKIDTVDFNCAAAVANQWTSQQLSEKDRDYLTALPEIVIKDDFTLVHGSPGDPLWEYVLTPMTAAINAALFSTTFCLLGHSHIPLIFLLAENIAVQIPFIPDNPVKLAYDRMIINPGSVGQPRDGDSRASYILCDSDSAAVCLRRVSYDIAETQKRMRFFALPSYLAARLDYGQ